LDLLKEETSLELEVDMEERLNAFRERKEEEVAVQLERQLDKREEIMRNKALIDVRKREAHIRAEIEAQLGLKRAEIRNRLQGLTEKMDAFKEMAEDKMRDAVTKQVQGELDRDEETYQSREAEFRELQTTDTRAEKRQMWMQSISGQNAPSQASTRMDPSALGARPDALGAAAGRPMRGMLGGQAPAQPRMGLAGMRAPATSSKPLAMPGAPLVKPIKAPLGASSAPKLVQPIQPKVVRTPLQPANQLVQPNVTPEVQAIPLPTSETSDASVAEVPASTVELEQAVAEEIAPIESEVQPVVEAIEVPTEAVVEAIESEVEEVAEAAEVESAMLRPITTVLSPASAPEPVKTTTLKPVPPQLVPKKARGAPPNIARGKAPTTEDKPSTATLTPVRRLTPLKINPAKKVNSEEEEEDA
jgi:hypothetical protein